MQIVFLCGGLGTRMREVNKEVPKGLMLVNNVTFFDYIINSILPYNPSSFHFCLGYKSDMYIKYINKLNISVKLTYSIEKGDDLLGTGGAIKNAIKFLDEDFIVQYGDTVLDFNYKKFYKYHLQNDKSMTMTILHKDKTEESPNVLCKKSKDGKLKCFYNKVVKNVNSNFIDYGAIAFKRNIFKSEFRTKFDLSAIQTDLCSKFKASFFEVKNRYIEIGTPKAFFNASNLLSL